MTCDVYYLHVHLQKVFGIQKIAVPYDDFTQPVFTCSKLTIKTLEQGVKYVQS